MDFEGLSTKENAKLNPPILLVLYFFIAGFCVDYFYAYLPGSSESLAMLLSGLSGIVAVCLSIVVHTGFKFSLWHIAYYTGSRNKYELIREGDMIIVTAKEGNEGRDTLINIERLIFSDITEAIP